MADTKYSALGASTTMLSTGLDSLANGTLSALGTEYDNATNKQLLGLLVLDLAAQGSNRSAGAQVPIYIGWAADGTNYDDANVKTLTPLTVFTLDDGALAARKVTKVVSIEGPGKFKLAASNGTGQAFAASGNTVKFYPYFVVTA